MSKPRHILAITYWNYAEALIQTYTLPYIHIIRKKIPAGSKIFLVTLEKDFHEKEINLKIKSHLLSMGIEWIPLRYTPFGSKAVFGWSWALIYLSFRIIKNRIGIIHCWATPGGAVGYFLSVITGRKLIIDSYEPHAEAMVENGSWKGNSMAFKLLFWLEKKQTSRASHLIAGTEGMREYARTKYGKVAENFYVKPACVDLTLFSEKNLKNPQLLKQLDLEGKIVCVYAGKLGGIYLEHEVFDFLKAAVNFWGDSFRFLLLSGIDQKMVNNFCEDVGIDPMIVRLTFVSHAEVPDFMGLADFAITPVKSVPTKKYCTPIKDGEYWALGLPVVITPNISDDSAIIEAQGIGAVLKGLDENSYREALDIIDQILKSHREERFRKIREVAETYRSFHIAERVYEKVYKQEEGE